MSYIIVMHNMEEEDRMNDIKKIYDIPSILVMWNIMFFEVHKGDHLLRYSVCYA
jgi:hypothetical protein